MKHVWWRVAIVIVATAVPVAAQVQAPTKAGPNDVSLKPDLALPSICQTLSDYFPIGAAIWQGDIAGPHAELLRHHFNSIVAENDMKWQRIHPDENRYNYAPADALVAFAKTSGMRIRGHTLVWHKQVPAWVFKDSAGNDLQPTPENKALLLGRLTQHIRNVVGHYRDDVYAWDVVNEVIDPNEPDGFRRTPWYRITGTDYIETAFRVARETAPRFSRSLTSASRNFRFTGFVVS